MKPTSRAYCPNCHKRARYNSCTSAKLFFRCIFCETTFEVEPTKEQKKQLKQYFKNFLKIPETHKLWHRFAKKFIPDMVNFKYGGYDLMCRVRKFAESNPIIITRCDDGTHAGSMFVLIPFETDTVYWGTIFISIPQFGRPCQMFMYKDHAIQLGKALSVVRSKHHFKKEI